MNPITITLPASGASLAPISLAGQAALYDTVPVTVTGRVWDTGHTYLAIISAHDDHLGGTDAVTVTVDDETGVLTWAFDIAFTSAALIAACTGPRLRVTLSLWDAVAGRHVFRAPLDVQYAAEPAGFVPSDPSITPATAGQIAAAIAAAGLGTGDVSGPASSTDGGLVAFSGLTGKIIKAGPAIGTTAGTVAAGNDARFTDARTPTAHASTHATGQADALTPAAIGAEAAGAVSDHNAAAAAHPFSAVDKYRYGGTDGATTEGTITAAGRAILDDATADEQRETLGLPKANLAATTAPSVTDDSTDGYSVGSRWIDTVGAVEYVCMDPAAGAAVWESTTGAAGVGGSTGAVDNAVLRADGAGGAAMQASDVIIDDQGRITRATINAPLEGYPNGTGGIRLAIATGQGGARGALGSKAIDLGFPYSQGLAIGAGAFAAGSYSGASATNGVVIGAGLAVTANNAAAIGGDNNTASGLFSFVGGGRQCTVSGSLSRAGGHSAVADLDGSDVWGAVNNLYSITSVGERMTVMMFGLTESLDAVVLLCHAAKRLVVPDNRTLLVNAAILGRAHATGHTGMCLWRALFSRIGTTTRLVGSAVEVAAWSGDSELGAPSAVISADDANESVSIVVTPGAATKTAWVAGITAWRVAGS